MFVLRLRFALSGFYSVRIVFCIGVVAVSKITTVGIFYIAWLGVTLKSYGSGLRMRIVCLFVCDLYCPSLFIPLLCDLLVLVTIGLWLRWALC